MSRLKKNLLGIPSGRIGDIIFKHRKGKPYISSAPAVIKKSESPAAVEGRNRTRLVSPLCKALTANLLIKTKWDNCEIIAESARHKIFKMNYPKLKGAADVSAAMILPSVDFTALVESYEWISDGLKIIIAPLAELKLNPMYYPEISANGALHLYQPDGTMDRLHRFLPVQSGAVSYNTVNPLTFIINLTADDKKNMAGYNFIGILLTLILKDKNQGPAACSEKLYFPNN